MECSLTAAFSTTAELQWRNTTIGGAQQSSDTDSASHVASDVSAETNIPAVPAFSGQTAAFFPESEARQHSLQSLKDKILNGKRLFADIEEELNMLDHGAPELVQPGLGDGNAMVDLNQTGTSDWLKDLQLLRHYLTAVYPSLCQDERMTPLWRDIIPDLALSHVSAFSACYCPPESLT